MASSSSSADGSCVPWDGGGQQNGGQQKGSGQKGARQKGAQQQQVSWLPEEDRKEEDGRKQSSSGQPTGKGRPFPVMFGLGKGGSDSDESETPDFENPCCHLGESGTDAFQPRAGPSHWLGTPPPSLPASPGASPRGSTSGSRSGSPPRPFSRFCCGCGEQRYTNHLLLDMGRTGNVEDDTEFLESEIGSLGEWQGQLWAYCLECAKIYKMLGEGTEEDQGKVFKREQKRRWKLRGVTHASASRFRRSWNFQKARED